MELGFALKDANEGDFGHQNEGPRSCRNGAQETRFVGFVRVAVLLIRGRSV